MKNIGSKKQYLFYFVAPLFWLSLLMISGLIKQTSWGTSGHPSNGDLVLIFILLSSAIFGLSGLLFVILSKVPAPFSVKLFSTFLNIGLSSISVYIWFLM